MSRVAILAIGLAVVFHVIVLLLILGAVRGSSADDPGTLSSASARAEVRGCRDRVEGGKIVPDRSVDTVISPMAFIRLPGTYRTFASRSDSELKPYPRVGMPMMKSIGVLRAGARVTLVVPRRQRRWMKLVYDFPGFRGTPAITLQACRRLASRTARRRECGWRPDLACRWRYTQFNGGIGLDFANVPQRGICAELIVRVKGKREPLRELLFDPDPGTCRDRED
jgi:hypothetical protein